MSYHTRLQNTHRTGRYVQYVPGRRGVRVQELPEDNLASDLHFQPHAAHPQVPSNLTTSASGFYTFPTDQVPISPPPISPGYISADQAFEYAQNSDSASPRVEVRVPQRSGHTHTRERGHYGDGRRNNGGGYDDDGYRYRYHTYTSTYQDNYADGNYEEIDGESGGMKKAAVIQEIRRLAAALGYQNVKIKYQQIEKKVSAYLKSEESDWLKRTGHVSERDRLTKLGAL